LLATDFKPPQRILDFVSLSKVCRDKRLNSSIENTVIKHCHIHPKLYITLQKNIFMIFKLKKIIFIFLLVVLSCAVLEFIGRRFMTPSCEIGRRILLGRETNPLVRVQNTIGQAYLNYICAPNYTHLVNGPQHNADGYRGKAVTLERQPGILRVLCLGGSTTYGWTVPLPGQTYPAALEELLRSRLPAGYSDIEVMNGGIPFGTSAEILAHYHFKYHYYRPDLVIINEGGNDAVGYTTAYYHPDNSNWRQPMVNLSPLPKRSRWLARSRFMSYIILNVFYTDQLYGGQFCIRDGAIPPAPWFKPKGKLLDDSVIIPDEQLCFKHNMETLVREILFDGAKVLLVPFRTAPGVYEANGQNYELSQIIRHEIIFNDFSKKYHVGFAPFPAATVSVSNWVDHCHLNAAGERQKAEHIAPYVLSQLKAVN
jgi:lysophospholipase L1-like esterase